MALQAPYINTGTMNVSLGMLGEESDARDHAVLMMDQAGWHTSSRVVWPSSITPLFLPPHSPELNSVERLWHWLRSHHLGNRVYRDADHLFAAASDAWNAVPMGRIKSVCRAKYIERGE